MKKNIHLFTGRERPHLLMILSVAVIFAFCLPFVTAYAIGETSTDRKSQTPTDAGESDKCDEEEILCAERSGDGASFAFTGNDKLVPEDPSVQEGGSMSVMPEVEMKKRGGYGNIR